MEEYERLCWFCKYISIFDCMRGWSENTPAEAWELYCGKEQFKSLHGWNASLDDFRRAIETGFTCEKFERREEI